MDKMLGRLCKRLLVSAAFAAALDLNSATALQINSYGFNSGGHFQVGFGATDTNHYYCLFRGSSPTSVDTPVSVALGANSAMQFTDNSPSAAMAFYRVIEVSTNSPLDADGDGIDDYYELTHSNFFNPLDPTDAPGDLDHDGYSNLQEYLWGTDPFNVTALPRHQLAINEIDYDNVGTDTAEFVELYNGSTNSLLMNGLALVFINGANNLEYSRINLSGTLAPGQYYVVASTNVAVAPGALMTVLGGSVNEIQNGAPDGVALIQVSTHTIVDSLAYEGAITNAVITGAPGTYNLVNGTALSASVADSNTVNGSLIRNPNGINNANDNGDWAFTTTPTPGAANVLTP